MKSIQYKKGFLKQFKQLPKRIQEELMILEEFFKINPFHPYLHTKKLQGKLENLYSFRINREYRVIFEIISENEIGIIRVMHRKDVYEK